jgi:hypothetical protein
VREIEPADIYPGTDELRNDLVASARRADRRNDFRVPNHRFTAGAISLPGAIPPPTPLTDFS